MSGELLLDGGDNELLHSLVRLGHQVHWRALLHDGDVFLQRLADHLAETRQTQRGRFLGTTARYFKSDVSRVI